MKSVRLDSERLVLRELNDDDVNDIVSGANNPNVSKLMSVIPYPYGIEDARAFVSHSNEERNKNPRPGYKLAIEWQGNFTGVIGLTSVDSFVGTATLGYWISEEFWKKGIGSEAGRRIVRFAFEELKLRRINVLVFAENTPSKILIEKLGFAYEGRGIASERSVATGNIHDSLLYGMLREEWEKFSQKE